MNFALPAGLVALLALAVPVLLHLSRRSAHRLIDFAALRWVQARRRARRRLRIVEPVLLALRCLLIATLALLLAAPFLTGNSDGRPWVLVSPGAAAGAMPAADAREDAEWRWLAAGFPTIDQPRPATGTATSSLLREVDARLPLTVPLQVQVPEELGGLDGQWLELGRQVGWKVVPGSPPATRELSGRPPDSCAVRLDGQSADLASWLVAAQAAWQHAGEDARSSASKVRAESLPRVTASGADVSVSATPPKDSDCLIWLRAGVLPDAIRQWVAKGSMLLLDPRTTLRTDKPEQADTGGVPVVSRIHAGDGALDARAMRMGRGRVIRLDAVLDRSADPGPLDGDFPSRLAAVLQGTTAAPDRALARDVAPVLVQSGKVKERYEASPSGRQRPFDTWLIWIAAVLFSIERVYALLSRRWQST